MDLRGLVGSREATCSGPDGFMEGVAQLGRGRRGTQNSPVRVRVVGTVESWGRVSSLAFQPHGLYCRLMQAFVRMD